MLMDGLTKDNSRQFYITCMGKTYGYSTTADELLDKIYGVGRALLTKAAADDAELFYASEAIFIVQYGLPYPLTQEHLKALKSFNLNHQPRKKDESTIF